MHNNFHRIPKKKKKIIKFAQFNLKYNILKRPTKFISKQNNQFFIINNKNFKKQKSIIPRTS